MYEGYISWLKMRKNGGSRLVLINRPGKLYALDETPDGMRYRWPYDSEADADYIAKEVGISVASDELALERERLECDRCGSTYTNPQDIELAKRSQADWEARVRKDGDEPRGICPCPIIPCAGELVLHKD